MQGSARREIPTLVVALIFIPVLLLVLIHLFLSPRLQPPSTTFTTILKSGKIRFLMPSPSDTSPAMVGIDNVAEFEHELAWAFAQQHHLKLELVVLDPGQDVVDALLAGQGDIIAGYCRWPSDTDRSVALSEEYRTVDFHLITRQSEPSIQDLADLKEREIYVPDASPYPRVVQNLLDRGLAVQITICKVPSLREVLHQVADGQIQLALADTYRAIRNQRFYPDLKLGMSVFSQSYHWVVPARATELRRQVDTFLTRMKADGRYDALYQRYLSELENFDYVDTVVFYQRLSTRLPKYIDIIREAAEASGFDWRLIAAQTYQESHFNKWAESAAQAYGLMQLTRVTARRHGLKNIINPRQNINAGVAQLKRLYDFYDKAVGQDRLLIALAAYNIGMGHILDARNQARDLGLDPNQWRSLAKTLPLLERPAYSEKAKYGYCKGSETITYVRHIMRYYDMLKFRYPDAAKTLAES